MVIFSEINADANPEFYGFFMYSLIITSIISLIIGTGCKAKRVTAPDLEINQPEIEEPKKEKIISPISPLEPREEVLGENLQTKTVKAEEEPVGKHKSIRISVEPDPDADYVQFAICEKDTQNCNPTVKEPLAFASHMHTFPDPPEGELEVYIRSCVAPNRAINFQRPCGNWMIQPYTQANNYDSKIRKLLIENYVAAQRVLDECHKIQKALEEYQSNNSKSQSQFDTLVANYLNHIPPQTCKTLMLSEEWQTLEQQITKESENISTQESARGSSVLLTLGVPAVLFGFVSYTTGVVYKNRFDDGISEYWTHHIKNYAEETPRLRPYDSLEEIGYRLKEVNAYIKAIENKPDERENYKKQYDSLTEEKKFLEAYKEFAEDPGSLFRSSTSYRELNTQPKALDSQINKLASDTEKLNEAQKLVRQAEIYKINGFDPRPNGSGFIEGVEKYKIEKPMINSRTKPMYHDLKYAGIIGTAIGAILIGVEVFGLEVRTVSDIEMAKGKLNQYYKNIDLIRSEIKERQTQIDNLTQN